MATIWRVRDRGGREVALTRAGWAHVMERHEDEMAGREEEVRLAVEAPDRINADADYAHREVFYRAAGEGHRMLRVVVHYRPVPPQGAWVGRVITAHETSRHKRGEPKLWP